MTKKKIISQDFIDCINKYAVSEDEAVIQLKIELVRGKTGFKERVLKINTVSETLNEFLKFFKVDLLEEKDE